MPMNWGYLAFLICTGTATGSLARHRGRSFYPWFLFGIFGFLVAIPWLLLTKSQLNDRAPPAGAKTFSAIAALCAVAVSIARHVLAPTVLPNCDYYTNISALNKSALVSPTSTAVAPKIITIKNIKELSRSDVDLRCTATAVLNNSTEVTMDYHFFLKDGKLLSESHW
jgi:hypothetical protein